jgi:amino acid permease
MSLTDYALLFGVLCVVAIAVRFRQRSLVRLTAVLFLIGVSSFALLSLVTFVPRWAASYHERQGRTWSEDFRDGVSAAMTVSAPHFPYLLLSSLGLGVIALMGPKRTQTRNDDT